MLTMLEVKLDIITPDIGGHGDNRGPVELADEVASRDTIQIRHDYIHQDEIVLLAILNLVDGLQTIQLLAISSKYPSWEQDKRNIPQCQ